MKDIRVVVVEDDPFARNWTAMLLVRDWRTHLAGELNAKTDVLPFLKKLTGKVDMILLDVDHFGERPGSGMDIRKLAAELMPGVRILLTGIHPQEHILQQTQNEHVCGYILKGEINNSLVWAVSLATEGRWVSTPRVEDLAAETGFRLPSNRVSINGHTPVYDFTPHELDVARLAFLFSLERRDLADEMKITEDWSYGLVSAIYKKLGLDELLKGETIPNDVLGNNALALAHLQRIIDEMKSTTSRKARDMETLAFHVLTMPEMQLYP
jgi:DNA-binding NarL/FixJ family response regulator